MEYITDPRAAELNTASIMVSWGYLDAKATAIGADGGIDVRSKSALAQVKWRGGMVGRPDIQRLYGAGGGSSKSLFFFAASGYSKQAITCADELGVHLFTYDPIGHVTAENRGAKAFMSTLGKVKPKKVKPRWKIDPQTLWILALLTLGVIAAFVLMTLTL